MDIDTASDNTSIDDKTEDFCENPTRDALTEGLMSLLKPTVDQLDERIRATRISQIELKQQIESLTEELVKISDYLQCPFELDSYVKKLVNAKQRVTVVSNILQTTQERLNKVHDAVEKDTVKRKALLDHSPAYNIPEVSQEENNTKRETTDPSNEQETSKNQATPNIIFITMETPIVKLTEDDLEKVYEPSEDSFLLIDSLEADLNNLKALKPMMCMEIGSGSGIVITALALASQKEWFSHFIAIDVNPDACRVTKNTSVINRTSIDIIQMDLTSAFQLQHIFDLIIFNPPYVITESIEIKDKNLITKSWAGGKDGREVMDRVILQIPELLTKNGIFYLVAIKENNIEDIIKTLEDLNMTGKVIGERKVRGEHLYVIKFVKE